MPSRCFMPHFAVAVGGQVHDLQHAVHILAGHPFQVGHDLQVFLPRQVQIAGGRLDQAAGLAQQGKAVALRHLLPQQEYLPLGGMDQPQQHFHSGAFSGAVGADKTVNAALWYVQFHVIHSFLPPVGFAQAFRLDHSLHASRSFARFFWERLYHTAASLIPKKAALKFTLRFAAAVWTSSRNTI